MPGGGWLQREGRQEKSCNTGVGVQSLNEITAAAHVHAVFETIV